MWSMNDQWRKYSDACGDPKGNFNERDMKQWVSVLNQWTLNSDRLDTRQVWLCALSQIWRQRVSVTVEISPFNRHVWHLHLNRIRDRRFGRSKDERSSRDNGFRVRSSTGTWQPSSSSSSSSSSSPSSSAFTRKSRGFSPGSATRSQRRHRGTVDIQRGKHSETRFWTRGDSQHESTKTSHFGARSLDDDSSSDTSSQSSFFATWSDSIVQSIVAHEASAWQFFRAQRKGSVFFSLWADVTSSEEHRSQQKRKSRKPSE